MKDENETPFVLTVRHTDGSSQIDAYATPERATWNFTDRILKQYVVEANITVGGGAIVLAHWRRWVPLHAPINVPVNRDHMIRRAIESE